MVPYLAGLLLKLVGLGMGGLGAIFQALCRPNHLVSLIVEIVAEGGSVFVLHCSAILFVCHKMSLST
jgi:hypothetical protein